MSFRSKETLIKIGLAAGAITVAGCGGSKEATLSTPTPVIRPIVPSAPGESLVYSLNALPPEMLKKYPEFNSNDYVIKSAFRVSTPLNKETLFYNLTDYQPNQEAIEAIYKYLEDYLGDKNSPSFILPNSNERIEIMPSPLFEKRATAVLSDNLAIPEGSVSPYGQTGWLPNVKFGSTFIRLRDFTQRMDTTFTPQEGYTWIFAVEACQQSLSAFVVDKDGHVVEDRERMLQAQEMVCNALGTAIARRIHGESWQQYSDWLDTRGTLNIPEINLVKAQIAKLDVKRYNAIPQNGTIFK